MTPLRTGPLAAGVLLGLISAAAATDPPVSPVGAAGGPPITLTDAQLDAITAGGCPGCPPPRNPFPDHALDVRSDHWPARPGGNGAGSVPAVSGGNMMAGGNPIED